MASNNAVLTDARGELRNLLPELEAAWNAAVKRTLLPNPRLKFELDRIKELVRALNGESTVAGQRTIPHAVAEVRKGIAVFRAYASASDVELRDMAYAGVIAIGRDPQRELREAAIATFTAAAPAPPPDRSAIAALLPELHEAARRAQGRVPYPFQRIRHELDRVLNAARELPVPQALDEVKAGIEVFEAFAAASEDRIDWMVRSGCISSTKE